VVAILLGRWECPPWKAMAVVGPVRRAGLALSNLVEGCDNVLRQWPAACISLLMLAALFGASMLLSF
jgi:multicomponent Na+:H+ antiporter subunit D